MNSWVLRSVSLGEAHLWLPVPWRWMFIVYKKHDLMHTTVGTWCWSKFCLFLACFDGHSRGVSWLVKQVFGCNMCPYLYRSSRQALHVGCYYKGCGTSSHWSLCTQWQWGAACQWVVLARDWNAILDPDLVCIGERSGTNNLDVKLFQDFIGKSCR